MQLATVVTPTWKAAMRRPDAKRVIILEITLKDGSKRRFCSGSRVRAGAAALIDACSDITTSVDHKTREPDIGEVKLTLIDHPAVQELVASTRLRGRPARLFWGCDDHDEFVPLFGGILWTTTHIENQAMWEFVIDGTLILSRRGSIGSGRWIQRHHLQALRSVLGTHIPPDMIDEASFNPDNYPSISHWNTARARHGWANRELQDATPIDELAAEICADINATLLTEETGRIKVVRYNPLGPSVRHFEEGVEPFNIAVDDQMGEIVNTATVLFGWRGVTIEGAPEGANTGSGWAQSHAYQFNFRDDESREGYALPGMSTMDFSDQFATKWVGAEGVLVADNEIEHDSDDMTVRVSGIHTASMCGMRNDGHLGWELDTTRPCYLMIGEGTTREIVRAWRCVPQTQALGGSEYLWNTGGGFWYLDEVPDGWTICTAEFTLSDRGLFGTVKQDHDHLARVVDVTIALERARGLVSRFGDGCPVIELTDVLAFHHDLQVTDLVEITSPRITVYRHRGLNRWRGEIIEKTIVPIGDDPPITFKIAEVRDVPIENSGGRPYDPYAEAPGWLGDEGPNWNDFGGGKIDPGDWIRPWVSGFDIQNTVDLDFTVGLGKGIGSIGGPTLMDAGGFSVPFNATIFVGLDAVSAALVRSVVAVEAAPAIASGMQASGQPITNSPVHPLRRITTGAAAVTYSQDLRTLGPQMPTLAVAGKVASIIENGDGQPMGQLGDRATTNYISNPSFEVDTRGWTAFEHGGGPGIVIARSTTRFLFGGASLQITMGTALGQDVHCDDLMPITEDVDYAFGSFYAYNDSGVANSIAWRLEACDADGVTLATLVNGAVFFPTTGVWRRVFIPSTLVTTAGAVNIRLILLPDAAAAGTEDWYVDAIMLEKSADSLDGPSSYFDGGWGNGFRWLGEENFSRSERDAGFYDLGGLAGASRRFMISEQGRVYAGGGLCVGRQSTFFRAYRSGTAQTGFTGADYTRCIFNEVHYNGDAGDDLGESSATGYSRATGAFTVQEDGIYLFEASAYLNNFAINEEVFMTIRQNGNDRSITATQRAATPALQSIGNAVTALLQCAKDDVIEVYIWHSGATGTVAMPVSAGNHFAGRRIG